MSSKHIVPPSLEDVRIQDMIAAYGGIDVESSDIQTAFREACALAVGKTAAYALTVSMDDMWAEFKEFFSITDTSEPFSVSSVLPVFLSEDGLNYITKQDGKAILQE